MESFKVKIKKTSLNNNQMRTPEIVGISFHLPQEGKSFFVLGDGLEFGTRLFNTSIVQSVNKLSDTEYSITTLNSTYLISLIND